MKRVFAVLLFVVSTVARANGESHPRVWSLAAPEATSLVGIQWQHVRNSVFGEAFRAELAGGGGLDLPDFDWLTLTDQILIAGPDILVIATGAYHAEFLKSLPQGIQYRNIAMHGTSKQTVAMLTEQTLLLGSRKTVQAAIDRSLAETRRPNGLFAKAAALSVADDFWVITKRLPDPVAGAFLPLDAFEEEVDAVEGGISFRDGLRVHGTLRASSAARAKGVSEHLRKLLPDMPEIARGMGVEAVDDEVRLELAVNAAQLAGGLKNGATTAKAEPAKLAEKKPEGPQIIRIFGLDEGTREIVLKKPDPVER